MQRIEALANISDESGRLTRTFCSPAMRRANHLVAGWMRQAGMAVREDAVGNVIGHYSESPRSKVRSPKSNVLLFGSHLDTVRDAGKFDGPLGVLLAITCVEQLHQQKMRLPYAIEVIGFSDEEGVRFQSAYLGSKAVAGMLGPADLRRKDAQGVTMAQAIQRFGGNPKKLATARIDARRVLGYLEVHIEQGPVLEERNLALGVVSAIAGQTRAALTFKGRAGHAGTTPMSLRRDALCAAAEFVSAVEARARAEAGLVGTVGEIMAMPGVSNVIPGEVRLSLDVRHAKDAVRLRAAKDLEKRAAKIAARRRMKLEWRLVQQTPAMQCDARLSGLLTDAVRQHQQKVNRLPSGAGHDAAILGRITPAAMLFVRYKGGISHHPDESVSVHDVEIAIKTVNSFLGMV